VPVAHSKICFIDGEKGILEYRGYPIEVLAEQSSFEETAYLLIKGKLPSKPELDDWKFQMSRLRRIKYKLVDLIKCLPETGHPMEALQAAVAALGMFYPGRKSKELEPAIRLVAKLPTLVAAYHRLRVGDSDVQPRDDLDTAQNFPWMLREREPDPFDARIFDICMVLHAEHSMNASTFSARVTGSTEADAYAVISSAVGTLMGPLHGGANEEVLQLLQHLGTPDKVKPYVDEAMARKDKVPGFGHRVYKTKDPRATILQGLAEQVFAKKGSTPLFDVARELEKQMLDHVAKKGIYPNVDFYSGIVYHLLGIETDLFTPIFAISRVAGWLAHWVEQMQDNRIFRPGEIYTGGREVPYTPLDER
jgi:citrate synthase